MTNNTKLILSAVIVIVAVSYGFFIGRAIMPKAESQVESKGVSLEEICHTIRGTVNVTRNGQKLFWSCNLNFITNENSDELLLD